MRCNLSGEIEGERKLTGGSLLYMALLVVWETM